MDASVEKSDKLENGANTDGTKSNRYRKASGGLSKAEKEEGELSPTRDYDDDAPPSPVSPVEDLDIRSPQYEVGETICSQDVVDDNDADADDEDIENASVAGEVSESLDIKGKTKKCKKGDKGVVYNGKPQPQENKETDGQSTRYKGFVGKL
ncbi:hypothetical protein QQ045_023972 [Rhodiola kirilowii]